MKWKSVPFNQLDSDRNYYNAFIKELCDRCLEKSQRKDFIEQILMGHWLKLLVGIQSWCSLKLCGNEVMMIVCF